MNSVETPLEQQQNATPNVSDKSTLFSKDLKSLISNRENRKNEETALQFNLFKVDIILPDVRGGKP